MFDPAQSSIVSDLGFDKEMRALRQAIVGWVESCNVEMRETLRWQFITAAKYFRPLTVFSCCRASNGEIPARIIRSALLIELFHNVSLVIDDIVDHSDYRRDRLTLHSKFGELPALMTAGYIVADGYQMAQSDIEIMPLLSDLLKRLGVAECRQWRLRRQALGVEDWRRIAAEDTGSMFETAAHFGDRSGRLRKFGALVGLLYHGCDDVADVRGTTGLGGGGSADLRDGILTLPAALAIRDPQIANLFCKPQPEDFERLGYAFREQLAEAEAYLDGIANEARDEARLFAAAPEPLLALVDHTRQLSQR